MAEVWEGDDLTAMLDAYRTLRKKTLWIHSDYMGNGPTLMLGEGPIQGGGGSGPGVVNNYMVGGGNLKILAAETYHSEKGHIASEETTWHRATDGRGGPVSVTVTPTVPTSRMLLRYNANVSFEDMNLGSTYLKMMFVRKDDKIWQSLVPSPEYYPLDQGDPVFNGFLSNARVINTNSPIGGDGGVGTSPNLDGMQGCSWVDRDRDPGLEPITYEVWVEAYNGGEGEIFIGQGGVPQSFEVIEILEGEAMDTAELPTMDPDHPPATGGVPAAMYGTHGTDAPKLVGSTLEAVSAGSESAATGVRTTGAVFSNVGVVNAAKIPGDWNDDGRFGAVYALSETDHIVGIDTSLTDTDVIRVAIDLPTPTADQVGRTYTIKDRAGQKAIYLRAANQTDPNKDLVWDIDGQAEIKINVTNRAAATVYCDGEGYYIV